MSRIALLNIDTQQSFHHRDYWQEKDISAFQQAMLGLIEGYVKPMAFLRHRPAVVFQKHVHNAFTDTGLDHWLRERDINQLIICGIRTEQCCETTARVASDLGYAVTFVSEATLTFPMTHKGITLSADELRHRTETVLAGRFADIKTVAQALESL